MLHDSRAPRKGAQGVRRARAASGAWCLGPTRSEGIAGSVPSEPGASSAAHERKRGRPVAPHAVMADEQRADALEALRAELPATSFVDDPESIAARSVDASFIPPEGRPLCLIAPAS